MDFDFFWKTYEESFPADERRSREQQIALSEVENYVIREIQSDDEIVGFITYWEFETFTFVEHFALAQGARGKGFGSDYLSHFLSTCDKRIVLEVEPPKEDLQKRRVIFYERLGFHLTPYTHVQTPFVQGRNGVLLQLMTYPSAISDTEFEEIETVLFSTVYR